MNTQETIDTNTTAGKIAVMTAFERGEKVEACTAFDGAKQWFITDAPSWNWNALNYRIAEKPDPYRTRRPLPTPPKRVPLDAGDIPSPCWIRTIKSVADLHPVEMQVVTVWRHGIRCFDSESSLQRGFDSLFAGYEYSTDRKNWLPCSKLEKEAA